MKRLGPITLAVFGAALTFGCPGEDAADDHENENGHEHDGDDEHGDAVELGTFTAGEWTVDVDGYGDFENAGEGVLDVNLPADAEGVAAVRAWYGIESGVGSMKSKLDLEGDKYHGHFEMPVVPPPGSEIWVEIELEDGTIHSGSVPKP